MDLPGLGWHTLPTMAAVCNAKAGLPYRSWKIWEVYKITVILLYCWPTDGTVLFTIPRQDEEVGIE